MVKNLVKSLLRTEQRVLHTLICVSIIIISIIVIIQDGEKNDVVNPLAQIENGTLTSGAGADAIKVLMLNIEGSYWKNNRERVRYHMFRLRVYNCMCSVESHGES